MFKNINIDSLYSYLDLSMSNRKQLAKKLIEVYTTNTTQRLKMMRENLALINLPGVKIEAHSIKSSSKMLGAELVMEICAQIESNCSGSVSEIKEIPHLIEDLAVRLVAAFEELKNHPILSENPLA